MTDFTPFRPTRRQLLAGAATLPLLTSGCMRATLGNGGEDALMRAAFYYAYPLYEFARSEQTLTGSVGQPGKINSITTRAQLSDHTARTVTAPNNDTVYASSFMDLSAGPIEVIVPTIEGRYFSVAFMNAMTDNFAYIGTRASNGQGGRYWVAGPQWQGEVPAGVELIQSATNDVWMLARILVEGAEDLPAARALLDKVQVVVPEGRPAPRGFANAVASGEPDGAKFLAVVNEMLRRSPGGKGELARATRFASVGIGVDDPSPETVARWDRFLPVGIADLREGFLFGNTVVDGWSYQPRGVGEFGENDRLRALVALGGIAALGEKEAMYFHANYNGEGVRLDGAHQYRWRIPPGGIPADGFWSVTMYEPQPDGRYYLVENPIQRYSIGDRTPGLVHEPDGSTIIAIQHDRPEGRLAANWLPAPDGPMRLALRAYIPRPELIAREWRVPPIERVDAN